MPFPTADSEQTSQPEEGRMYPESLKIEKKLKEVTLWVHPEGMVVGSVFVRLQSPDSAAEEDPAEVLNAPEAFLVMRREPEGEIRFYNKNSIVRVEYQADEKRTFPELEPLGCTLRMMDGSNVQGMIRKPLPPDRARLLDYLNRDEERFIKVDTPEGRVYLVNKPYVVCAFP
jgi:hypothetical protein